MRPHSLMIASALVIGLAMPAAAQQSMHRYATFFKYSDEAMKAMMEHPQDRQAAAAKLAEEFGGKLIGSPPAASTTEWLSCNYPMM